MSLIQVHKVDEVYVRIFAEDSIIQEISDYFTFTVPDFSFKRQGKKYWDGKIRIFNKRTKQLYFGLVRHLEEFAKEREYQIEVDSNIKLLNNFSLNEGKAFIDSLNIHSRTKPVSARDYQIIGLTKAIRYKKIVLESPTASGKSFIIYTIVRYLLSNKCKKGLLIVPTTSLVEQMYKDFYDYSNNGDSNPWRVNHHCYRVYDYDGCDRSITKDLTISTWQSVVQNPDPDYLKQFDFVIGDEAHTFEAKSLAGIMKKLVNAEYRIGTTGTTKDMKVHKLTLEGYFGPITKLVSTKALMDQGHIATLHIKTLILKYSPMICNLVERNYQKEIEFLFSFEPRNRFIINLALSLKNNTLVLFQYIEKHGDILMKMINEKNNNNRKIFFVTGKTETEARESIRAIVEKETDAIIIASVGVFSTGVNIRNLHNIIFASPSKSKIRNLQSIGRSLRLGDNKDKATLFDIVDDLRSDNYVNYTLKHYAERYKIYSDEKFKVSTYNIEIKNE